MAITQLEKHDHCDVWVVIHPEKTHYASLVCRQHNAWIQWLSREDTNSILSQGLAEIRPRRTKIISFDELGL